MHQFTSCISTDSNTKVNRHRLLYHSSEEGSGCLKKRKDKLQRSIVRIRKKKGGTLSVIRALSSHLSATRPGLSDRKEKKDIPPPTIYQRGRGSNHSDAAGRRSRGVPTRSSRWAGNRIERGIAGKRMRLVRRCGYCVRRKATQGDATRLRVGEEKAAVQRV